MAYVFSENSLGWQPIAVNETTQKHKLGTVRRAVDPTLGEGEFIYLKGINSTVVGSVVSYTGAHATALASLAADTQIPLAVAMSACVTGEFGWYQIGGLAAGLKVLATSFAAGANITVTSGVVTAAASAGVEPTGMVVAAIATASAGTSVDLMIDRPHGPSS